MPIVINDNLDDTPFNRVITDTSALRVRFVDTPSFKRLVNTSSITNRIDDTPSVRGMVDPSGIRMRNRCILTVDGKYRKIVLSSIKHKA